MNLFSLMATIGIDDSQFTQGINRSQSAFSSFGKKVVGVIATLGIAKLTSSIVKMGIATDASMEQSKVAWTTLLGTQEKSKKMLDDINKYAAKTPFSKMGVDEMAKQLNNAGFVGKELFDQLTKFGDMGSAFGIQEASLKEMVRQYGQVQQAGVAYTEDLNILQDRGIPIYKALAESMGITTGEVKKMASEGKLSADIYNKAVDSISSKTKGAMEEQSKTFNGLWSTLKDNFNNIAGKIMIPIFKKLKEGMETIMPIVDGISGAFDKFNQKIEDGKTFSEAFTESFRGIIPDEAIQGIIKVKELFTWVLDNKDVIIASLAGIGTAMLIFDMVRKIQAMVEVYRAWRVATEGLTVAQWALNAATSASGIAVIIAVVAALVIGITILWKTNEGFRKAVVKAWETIKKKATELGESIDKVFKDLVKAISKIPAQLVTIGKNIIQGLVNGMIALAKIPAQIITRIANGIITTIKNIFGIHSPSKLMEEYGEFIDEGLKLGMENGENDILSQAKSIASGIEDSIKVNIDKLKSFGDAVTEALKNQYEALEDTEITSIGKRLQAQQEASKKTLAIYDEEYMAKLKIIDKEAYDKTKALQDEINEIDKKTDEENKVLQKQAAREEKVKLKTAIKNAKTGKEKKKAQDNLRKFLVKEQRKELLASRKLVKDNLKTEIEIIKEKTNEVKEQLKEDYEDKEDNENKKIEKVKSSSEKEIEIIKEKYAKLKDQYNIDAEAIRMITEKNQDGLIDLLEAYNPKWQDAGQDLTDKMLNGLNSNKESIKAAVDEMLDIAPTLEKQGEAFDSLNEKIKILEVKAAKSSSGIIDSIAGIGIATEDVQKNIEESIDESIDEMVKKTKKSIKDSWEDIKKISKEKWEDIKKTFEDGWKRIKEFFSKDIPEFIDKIVTWIGELPGKVKKKLDETYDKVVKWFKDLIELANKKMGEFTDKIVTWIAELPGKVKKKLDETYAKVTKWFKDLIELANKKMGEFIGKIVKWFGELPGKMLKIGEDIVHHIGKGIENKYWWIRGKIDIFIGKIVTWFKELPGKMEDIGEDIVHYIGNGIESKYWWIRGKVGDFKDDVVDWFEKLPGKILDIGKDIVYGLWNGINEKWYWIKYKVGGFAKGVVDAMKDMLGIHSPSRVFADEIGKFIPQGITLGIDEASPKMIENFKAKLGDMVASVSPSFKGNGQTATASGMTVENNMYGMDFSNYESTAQQIENNVERARWKII